MTEGGIADRELAALALKQASGDNVEAIFLLRAYRTTCRGWRSANRLIPRRCASNAASPQCIKISPAASCWAPLTTTPTACSILPCWPTAKRRLCSKPMAKQSRRRTSLACSRSRLAKTEEDRGTPPDDITRTPPVYPCSRSSRLQQLMRGDEGYLLALAYSTQRGYGRNHPFAGEIRSGYVQVEIVPEELGFSVNIGELLLTECEMVNGFVAPQEPPHFTRGYGLTFGMSERKAMAMALVDRALQAPDYDEEIAGPAQDEEFVLAHADNVEAAGFVSHLKLPHYVDFRPNWRC